MGLFISFEGGEGSGKSTQAGLLAQRLRDEGWQVVSVREPGSTPLGDRVRELLKNYPMSHGAELLLFGAARAELVAQTIKPALKAGYTVVADRYADSTTAYQRYGRKLPARLVDAVIEAATQGVEPDLTVLLDLPPELGLRRLGRQLDFSHRDTPPGDTSRLDEEGRVRFEEEPLAFHQRVRKGYQRLAQRKPQRWLVVDATLGQEAIHEEVWARVRPLLQKFDLKARPGTLFDTGNPFQPR